MTEVRAELGNVNELHAVVASPGDAFAFYLYRNNQIVEKTGYSASNAKRFVLRERGTYVVKGYSRTDGHRGVSGMSNRVTFSGLPTIPRRTATRNLIVFGVSTVSAFAALLIGRKHNVAGIFDPTGKFDGQKFHGQQIFAKIPHGFDLVAFEQYDAGVGKLETFSLVAGRDDVLSQSIDTLGIIELHNIGQTCHKSGLVEGASYLQSFIRVKFACRLPNTVEIGDGTMLSLSGLGTAVHPKSVIGRNCKIGQNVTLGGKSGKTHAPIIGDNVHISPGAQCLGGKIGNNVVVGAGAVVTKPVPSNCVVAGVPAKIISTDMSKYGGYIRVP